MRYAILCLLLAACVGGHDDYSEVPAEGGGTVTTAGVCEFASREDAERAVAAGVICRVISYGNKSED